MTLLNDLGSMSSKEELMSQSETAGRLLHGLMASGERTPNAADDSPYSLLPTSYSPDKEARSS